MPLSNRTLDYAWQRWFLRRRQLVASADVFGLQFLFNTADDVGRRIFKYGCHEPLISRYLIDNLKLGAGDVAIDVGANLGWYACLLNALSDAGARVLAFEPHPDNHRLLQHNLQLNRADRVTPLQLGLADRAGNLPLHLCRKKNNHGRHSLVPMFDGHSIEVPVTTLDRYWSEHGGADMNPRFIKIDIEGYEYFALKGGTEVVRRCAMAITEYSPAFMHQAGIQPRQLLELMSGLGFSAHLFTEHGITQVSTAQLADSSRQQDILWLNQG